MAAYSIAEHPTTPTTSGGLAHRWTLRAGGGQERFRAIYADQLNSLVVEPLLDRWCARAQRAQLPPFIKLAR